MAGLLDIFGGGSADPYDIYGDLFTEKQKAAMRSQQQGQGLLRMAGAFADAGMPSRLPIPLGAAIGKAAAAMGAGQDAQMEQMLNAAKTAELVRQSQQTRALQQQFGPLYADLVRRIRAQQGLGTPATAPGAAPGAPAPSGAPAAATPFSLPEVPSYGGALGAAPAAAGRAPGAGASLDNDPTQLAGLLATPDAGAMAQLAAGGPDQVVGQGPGQLQGLLSAAYAPGGGANGRLPFGQDDGQPSLRLASAALAPYAIGNAVMGGPSSVEGVGDALSQKITDMVAKMPPDIAARFKIISGYRDAARQAQVNPGAPNSRHGAGTGPPGTGMAVDLQSDPAVLDWITKNQNDLGVGFPLAADPKERNHLEMLTAEGARLGGSARRGGRFAGMGPDAGGGGGQDPALGQLAALSTLTGLLGVPGFPDISSFLKSTSGSGSGSGSSVAPSSSGDVLDSIIAPLESGNRNIMQQVVGPGGGYNPSVGRVTGPSSAGGYYQITNSTWQDTAPKAGVDLARYPTAISAPREVQKQVAQQLLDTRGLQPWADFNPAVAAATGYRRGGRFAGMGPDTGGGASGDEADLTGLLQRISGPGGLLQMSGGGAGPAPDAASAGGDGPAAPDARLIAQMPSGSGAPAAPPVPAPAPRGMPQLATPPGLPAPPVSPGGAASGGLIPGLGVSPQELAVLNSMAEMAKLGTPFNSLLETYYKSPGYLGEKAAAETKARTDIEDPLNQRMKVLDMALDMRKNGILYNPQTGEIKADPEWDRIHGRRAEDTKILELDYAKRLKTFEEQQKIAEEVRKDQKEIAPQPIYRGGAIVEQPMTREAAVARLKDQSMRPGEYRDGDIVAKPIGNLSPDYQYKMSPTGGLTVEPIANTPAAEKAADVARKREISDRQLLITRDRTVQDVDRLENLAKTSPLPVTGMFGSVLSTVPGMPQNDARVLIDSIKARASMDAINQARASTGSTGLGQITMGEHAILANAIASLEQSQTQGQFLIALRRFKEAYVDAVHGPGAYSKFLPDTPVIKPPSSAPPGASAAPAGAASIDKAAYDRLPSGATYTAPDGTPRVKR